LVIDRPYYIHLAIITFIYSIIVMGIVLQFRVGLISIGAATFWGVGAYSSAFFAKELGLSFLLCLPLAGMTATILGLCLGVVLVRCKGIIGFLTLSLIVNAIFVEVMASISLFGGREGISAPGPSIYIPFHAPVEVVTKTQYYYLALFLILMVVVALYALYKSRIGRSWQAIGLSLPLAAQIGVNLFRYKLLAYVIAALTSGLAGSFYVHYQCCVVPSMFDIYRSFDFLLFAVIGGMGYFIAGPIIGSLIGVALPELLRIGEMYEPIFFGMVVILVILRLPGGVLTSLPIISSLATRLSRRVKTSRGG
jgi:branched-chain amino acid transport system permease protein